MCGQCRPPKSRIAFRISAGSSLNFDWPVQGLSFPQCRKTADPSRPYSAPKESNLLWLRTITTGVPDLKAHRRTRRIRPEPLEKQVVSKIRRSSAELLQCRIVSNVLAGVQESSRRIRGEFGFSERFFQWAIQLD